MSEDPSGGDGDFSEAGGRSDEITMKRSAYYGFVVTAIVGIAVGTFFAGYFVAFSTSSPDYVTRSQLENLLSDVWQQQQQQQQHPAGPGPTDQRPAVSLDDDPMLGNPDAPVTIVEFSDFQCPFCSRFHQQTLPLIVENYVETGAVNVVYRDYPIDAIHPNARITHIASECADEQDMFWEYHDILFERQSEWSGLDPASAADRVVEYARMLSLDAGAFSECLLDPDINAEIEMDKTDGSRYGVTGTPAFFIGNDHAGYAYVNGAKPFESFALVIDEKLAG